MSDKHFRESEIGGLGVTSEELAVINEAERQDTDQHPESAATPASPMPAFQFHPIYVGPSSQQLDEMAADLDRQLEGGDIDILGYTRLRDPIVSARFEAGLVQKHHEGVWRSEQTQFFNDHPEFRDDPALNGALQRIFKSLDTAENGHKTGLELLNEARRQIEESAARVLRERRNDVQDDRSGPGIRIDFDHLDGLTGIALEDALSRLPAEEAERYLRG